MLSKIFAGLVASSGWLVGAFLYSKTQEEWELCAKWLGPFKKFAFVLALVLGLVLGWFFSDTLAVGVFTASLLFGSFASVKSKNWGTILISFSIQLLVFVLVFVWQTC